MKGRTIISGFMLLWAGIAAGHAAAAGDALPKVITIGTLSNVYEPVRFNHEEHVSMAGGCADCHHQHRSMNIKTCSECHRIDPASFKKNVMTDHLLPCRDCHSPAERPGATGQPALKIAYHQACLKCHWGEVGSSGKNLASCTEMCHVPKSPGKAQGKK